MTNIIVDLVVSFVLLLLLFGWIACIWLWVSEIKEWWGSRKSRKIRSRKSMRL